MPNYAPFDKLVGGAFSRLGEGVRRAHSSPLRAEGELCVEWSRSRLARWMAWAMRLPPEGPCVPTRLEVSEGVWIRHFGPQRVVTRQWARDGFLVERYGPFRTRFRLVAKESALRYRSEGAWVGAVRLPTFLAPTVETLVEDAEGGWRVEVRISHPCLGLICRYYGVMRPL